MPIHTDREIISRLLQMHGWPMQMLRGDPPGHKVIRAFGERVGISTAAAGDDVWPGPSAQVPIPTQPGGQQMEIVSTSASDAAAGTGVQELEIHYLDSAGLEDSETIIPAGLVAVQTVATDIRFVQRIHATQVGSNGVAVGDISLQNVGGGSVFSFIQNGGNYSLLTNRMVPANKNLYVQGWHAEEARGGRVRFRLRTTSDDDGTQTPIPTFLFKDVVFLESSTSGFLPAYFHVPALSIVKVTAWAIAVNSEGSAGWWGVLIDD